jgi:DNA mismatch repair protein MutS
MSAAPGETPSVLFPRAAAAAGIEEREQPAFFTDLNLDRILRAVIAGREEYALAPYFYAELHDVADVRYRHEVVRDLEDAAIRAPVDAFARGMRTMRERLAQAQRLRHPHQRERWFLDAIAAYCAAVAALSADLAAHPPASRGLTALREHLAGYLESEAFTTLAAGTDDLARDLAAVSYGVHIRGNRVTVTTFAGEADYSAQVEEAFAKFARGAVRDYRVDFAPTVRMNHIEERVLDLVARLHPELFERLGAHCARHGGFVDPTIRTFDREVQFYLAYLDHIGRFRSAGLPFCLPRVSARSAHVHAEAAFDLALADALYPQTSTLVCNGFSLDDPERVLVVSGPNQGGKTTFARTFGQLHHLAALGLPVPAAAARLHLPDRMFTHFERVESLAALTGKLEDELVRIHEVLRAATRDSVVIMNESFTSTTLDDAVLLGTEVLGQLIERGSLCLCVTFVDELASLGPATVSMVGTVEERNPAVRTYRIERRPADGLAYAWAIAEKYGLTYRRLRERIGS